MRRTKDYEVHLMPNWLWARWDWNHCVVCKEHFRAERYFVVFEPMNNIDFCMKCCKTKDEAGEAYEKYLEDRKNFRPPAPKGPPPARTKVTQTVHYD